MANKTLNPTLSSVQILEKLVAVPTVSRNSNLPLIDWVRNYLADVGVESHLIPDATGSKSNLFASIGPPEEGGLVFSGHTDVVPVDGQVWSSDPFKLTARGSRLHARGACDMKGFIAATLSCVPGWKAAQLSRPVHLMFSYDEEVGCLGAPAMIAAARSSIPHPAAVIVGEPTGMRVATAHKGVCVVRTLVHGVEAHSSLTHQGASAVMLAADLIAFLGAVAEKISARAALSAIKSDGGLSTHGLEPPYTTLSVNHIQGGTAFNILAAKCEFKWDIRVVPGESSGAILDSFKTHSSQCIAELMAVNKPCTIESFLLADVPPLQASGGLAEVVAHHASQSDGESLCVPFATEAGQFQSAGWSTVVCGPGSISQAHKPDEYIEAGELADCEKFLNRAVMHQCK